VIGGEGHAQALPRGKACIKKLRCNAIIKKSCAQALAPFPIMQQTTCLNQITTQYHLEYEIETGEQHVYVMIKVIMHHASEILLFNSST